MAVSFIVRLIFWRQACCASGVSSSRLAAVCHREIKVSHKLREGRSLCLRALPTRDAVACQQLKLEVFVLLFRAAGRFGEQFSFLRLASGLIWFDWCVWSHVGSSQHGGVDLCEPSYPERAEQSATWFSRGSVGRGQ